MTASSWGRLSLFDPILFTTMPFVPGFPWFFCKFSTDGWSWFGPNRFCMVVFFLHVTDSKSSLLSYVFPSIRWCFQPSGQTGVSLAVCGWPSCWIPMNLRTPELGARPMGWVKEHRNILGLFGTSKIYINKWTAIGGLERMVIDDWQGCRFAFHPSPKGWPTGMYVSAGSARPICR